MYIIENGILPHFPDMVLYTLFYRTSRRLYIYTHKVGVGANVILYDPNNLEVFFWKTNRAGWSIYQRYVGSSASKRKTFLLPTAPDLPRYTHTRIFVFSPHCWMRKKEETLPPLRSEGIIHSLKMSCGWDFGVFKRLEPVLFVYGYYIMAHTGV